MAFIASLQVIGPLFGAIISSYTHSSWAIKLSLLSSPMTAPYAATSLEVAAKAQWGVYHPMEFVAAGFPLLLAALLPVVIGRPKAE
jgi:hypothetical protein